MSSHKTCRIKRFLAKNQKQNHPIPQWIQMRTGNKTRSSSKRRPWRRTRLTLWSHIGNVQTLSLCHCLTPKPVNEESFGDLPIMMREAQTRDRKREMSP
ncbi:60S ribosomal protein L39-like [Arvicola amphibius]|uniref:60S ribosomal protein L39-like n=1 Tax=Arvicola amphibius TaxID=1047088 RepID=UPI001C08A48E|nr:60S ribosomal protein L39-like [Arvicola amphibius]